MNLNVTIAASPYDEECDMAYMYCFDQVRGYCFSLARFPHSDEIEVMVLDQLNHLVNDLSVVLDGNSLEVTLEPDVASCLDGHTQYSIQFEPTAVDRAVLVQTLNTILEGK